MEIECIHERCRRLQQSARSTVSQAAQAPLPHVHADASLHPSCLRAALAAQDSTERPAVRDLGGGGGGDGCKGGRGAGGNDAEADGSMEGGERGETVIESVALQERINLLHKQLESALSEEDFELCDALNAEITTLSRKRDALLDS